MYLFKSDWPFPGAIIGLGRIPAAAVPWMHCSGMIGSSGRGIAWSNWGSPSVPPCFDSLAPECFHHQGVDHSPPLVGVPPVSFCILLPAATMAAAVVTQALVRTIRL